MCIYEISRMNLRLLNLLFKRIIFLKQHLLNKLLMKRKWIIFNVKFSKLGFLLINYHRNIRYAYKFYSFIYIYLLAVIVL